jgi:hypothetical protein
MERNVTNLFTEYLIESSHRSSSDRGPSPLELQRWEDDGGAVLPDLRPSRAERLDRGWPAELAAAE